MIGTTESDHLPNIWDQPPTIKQPDKGPIRFDFSRVPTGYRLWRDPVAWTESGDVAYDTEKSRNDYAAKLDTLAKHTAGNFGKSKMGRTRAP